MSLTESGIVTMSSLPVRTGPDQRNGMCNQLLAGETFRIKKRIGEWMEILSDYDHTSGWVAENACTLISEEEHAKLGKQPVYHLRSLARALPNLQEQYPVWLLPGSTLRNFNADKLSFTLGQDAYVLDKPDATFKENDIYKHIEQTARVFPGTPEIAGGRSLFGMDASGFIQILFKINGVFLPREAGKQVEQGTPVSFLEEAKAGDLAFFDSGYKKIDHVGLLLGNGTIMHVSGKVRIDPVDNMGISDYFTAKYRYNLRLIKSFF